MEKSKIWCGKDKGKGCCSVHGGLKPEPLKKAEERPLYSKAFKRQLAILAGTYEFDAVVPEHQREWYREQAKNYIDTLVRCYSL